MTVWAVLGLATACSVKEDRSDCPCWITVTADKSTSISAWFGSHRILDNHQGGLEDHMMPRGIVDLVASDGDFTVPEGMQMNELFAQLIPLDTDGEFAHAHVELKKQFANVNLAFKDTEDGRVDLQLNVRGTVCGADERTLQPKTGPFSCAPEESPQKGYQFRVPRQKDESLIVERITEDGEELPPIPLGTLIKKAGFDWTKESLGDVSIIADIPESSFLVTIMEWDGPVIFEITI